MPKLSGPYEIFDIGDGEAVQVKVTRYEKGEVDIHPGYGTAIKTVNAMRIYLDHPWVEGRLAYIDITSQRLLATLEPLVQGLPAGGKYIRITKRGVAPLATFAVQVIP